MRIGVDATCWAHGRGYGRFVRELLPVMAAQAPDDEFLFFADPLSAERFTLSAPNVRLITVAQSAAPVQAAAAEGARGPIDLLRLSAAVWREAPDVFFMPTVYTYFPLAPGQKAVVGVLDAIAERYPELTLPSRRARLFWNAKVALAIHQARLVLTLSDYSERDIARVFGLPRGAIRQAVPAPSAPYRTGGDAEQGRARLELPRGARWLTYVGGFSPHKRVDAIVRAHGALAREMGADTPWLVLVGTLTGDAFLGDQPRIRAAIDAAGTGHLVRWTGFLSDDELRDVHAGAVALLLPSLVEGFGLPAVEAAACGCPVIATTESPLPELLADGGIFVDPMDEAALVNAMRRLLVDEPARAAMGRAAARRAGALTWERAAAAALAALREAA